MNDLINDLNTAIPKRYYNVAEAILKSSGIDVIDFPDKRLLTSISSLETHLKNSERAWQIFVELIGQMANDELLGVAVKNDLEYTYKYILEHHSEYDIYGGPALIVAAEFNKIKIVEDLVRLLQIEQETLIYAMIVAIQKDNVEIAEYLLHQIIIKILDKGKIDKFEKTLKKVFNKATTKDKFIKNKLQDVHDFLKILPDLCRDLKKEFTKNELKTITALRLKLDTSILSTKSQLCAVILTDAFKFF